MNPPLLLRMSLEVWRWFLIRATVFFCFTSLHAEWCGPKAGIGVTKHHSDRLRAALLMETWFWGRPGCHHTTGWPVVDSLGSLFEHRRRWRVG